MSARSCRSVQAKAQILAFDRGQFATISQGSRPSAGDDQAPAGDHDPAAVLTTNGIDAADARQRIARHHVENTLPALHRRHAAGDLAGAIGRAVKLANKEKP